MTHCLHCDILIPDLTLYCDRCRAERRDVRDRLRTEERERVEDGDEAREREVVE